MFLSLPLSRVRELGYRAAGACAGSIGEPKRMSPLKCILELALELWCPWPLLSFMLLNTQKRGTAGLSTSSEQLVVLVGAEGKAGFS